MTPENYQFDTSDYIIDKDGDGRRYHADSIEAIKREAYNQAIEDVLKRIEIEEKFFTAFGRCAASRITYKIKELKK